jgi:hypothetical protein
LPLNSTTFKTFKGKIKQNGVVVSGRAIVIPLAIEFRVNLMILKKINWSKKKQNGGENQDGRQA